MTSRRLTVDEYFLRMASLVSQRATCLRRRVGCVLVDERNHVLSTGYNGRYAGAIHCNTYDEFDSLGFPHACDGAFAPTGERLEECEAIHAEQNALLQCRDVYSIAVAYVTVTPCVTCIKLLLNTSCKRIVASELYPHEHAMRLWRSAGRQIDIVALGNADG